MTNGTTYLLDLLNGSSDTRMGIDSKEFASALKEGMQTEPEKFPQLVDAFEARIRRAYPDWSPDKTKQRALGNIAVYALMADHDYESVLVRAKTDGRKMFAEWYDDTQDYGLAMIAFAKYVGTIGASLREFILDF